MLEGTCAGANAGEYFIYTDWLTLAYDGCPLATGAERAVLLAYDNTGNYTLQSRLKSQSYGTWDSIGTIAAAPLADFGTVAAGSAANLVNVTFAPANIYGNYEGAAPATPLITGFQVYVMESATDPVNFLASAWTAVGVAQTVTGASTTVNDIGPVSLADPTNNNLYMTVGPIFEGTTVPHVYNGFIQIIHGTDNPLGGDVISSISANQSGLNTNVNWTSADESNVTSYQVFWAPQGGDYTAVGSRINTMGNNHSYSASVRIPSTGTFNVKVGAYKTNGEIEYSSIVNVKSATVIKTRTADKVD